MVIIRSVIAQLRRPRLWIGTGVSLLALYFALRGVSWPELAAELRHASYGWLLPAALVVVVGQLARAARWQVLFGRGPRPRFRAAFAILSIGYFVSYILPFRLGDPVRAWLVETRTPAGGAEGLATIFVERAVDFLTIAALLAVWVPVPASRLLRDEFGAGHWVQPDSLRLVALGLVVAVYAGCVLMSFAAGRSGRFVTWALGVSGLPLGAAGRAGELVSGFAAGLAPLRRARTALLTVAWSMVVWLIGGVGYWLVFKAFDLDLPFAAAIFAMGATALFAILPSSPGYVGVFHYGVRVGLATYASGSAYDVPDATAVSYAIVLHGVTTLTLIVLGVVGLWMLGLSGAELGRRLSRTAA